MLLSLPLGTGWQLGATAFDETAVFWFIEIEIDHYDGQ
jgi:hypothetical protein